MDVGCRSSGGLQVHREPAVCLCGQEGQQYSGVPEKECGQQVKGGSLSLLYPSEAAPGLPCRFLVYPIREGQESPE